MGVSPPLPIPRDRGHERQSRGKGRLCGVPRVMGVWGGGGGKDQSQGVAGATRSSANERARRRCMRGVTAPPTGRRGAQRRQSAPRDDPNLLGGTRSPNAPTHPRAEGPPSNPVLSNSIQPACKAKLHPGATVFLCYAVLEHRARVKRTQLSSLVLTDQLGMGLINPPADHPVKIGRAHV